MNPAAPLLRLGQFGVSLLNRLSMLFDLGIRLYLADVFFKSGLTKIRDWDTTLALFTDEYHVPWLSPEVAAAMGAGAELLFPVMLVLGLGTRFAACGLFVLNIVAVISYPDLVALAIKDHYLWGCLLAVLVFHGPGKLSADSLLNRRLNRVAG